MVSGLNEHMVPDLDAILNILECNNSASNFRSIRDRFSWWEDVFQYSYDSETQSRCETFEYQVGVGFADGTARAVWDIMTKDDIV